MPKQKTRKSQKELGPASMVDVDAIQFARYCYRKTLLSLCYMWPCTVRMQDQLSFTSLSMPSNEFGEKISDIG
jgi:hypothetical protein